MQEMEEMMMTTAAAVAQVTMPLFTSEETMAAPSEPEASRSSISLERLTSLFMCISIIFTAHQLGKPLPFTLDVLHLPKLHRYQAGHHSERAFEEGPFFLLMTCKAW